MSTALLVVTPIEQNVNNGTVDVAKALPATYDGSFTTGVINTLRHRELAAYLEVDWDALTSVEILLEASTDRGTTWFVAQDSLEGVLGDAEASRSLGADKNLLVKFDVSTLIDVRLSVKRTGGSANDTAILSTNRSNG